MTESFFLSPTDGYLKLDRYVLLLYFEIEPRAKSFSIDNGLSRIAEREDEDENDEDEGGGGAVGMFLAFNTSARQGVPASGHRASRRRCRQHRFRRREKMELKICV